MIMCLVPSKERTKRNLAQILFRNGIDRDNRFVFSSCAKLHWDEIYTRCIKNKNCGTSCVYVMQYYDG